MPLLSRHLLAVAIVSVALLAAVGMFAFARPEYRPEHHGVAFRLPAGKPAADASGAAGWVWPEGVPGWAPGQTMHGVDVAGMEPVETKAAQLAAARAGLDPDGVRVVSAARPNGNGVLAILAAPTRYETPIRTCLAAVLQGSAPVVWSCPGARPVASDLSHAHVLLAAAAFTWPPAKRGGAPRHVLYVTGVARGDVARIAISTPGSGIGLRTIYTRGATWCQFDVAQSFVPGRASLAIYGRRGLLERLPLRVAPGRQRALR